MAEQRRVQFPDRVIAFAVGFFLILALVSSMRAFAEPQGTDVSNRLIRESALGPVFFWSVGWPVAFARKRRIPGMRLTWALGSLLCLFHIAVAFHLGHGWSHAVAWEHTRRIGGYGDGIFVNYTFALVWFADGIWAWVAFDSYRHRPQWLNTTIHGFLAFVVFNAAVVFGTTNARLLFGLGMLLSTAFVLRVSRKSEPGKSPGSAS